MPVSDEQLQTLLHTVSPSATTDGGSHAVHDRLVDAEDKSPGTILQAVTPREEAFFVFPNGPLIAVGAEEQARRIERTVTQRWSAAVSELSDINALVTAIKQAQVENKTLRVVGSARSLSRAPEPEEGGTLSALAHFDQRLALEESTLRPGIDVASLYRAEAGRVLSNVLIDLDSEGRALADMGSGDFQGLAGALSTSTHGSGVKYPAFPGIVRSLDVVTIEPTADGNLGQIVRRRIEPTLGITDPEKFKILHEADGMELIQDDEVFQAWTVSVGCLGVICSLVIDVVPRYWLHETRRLEYWSSVKSEMQNDLNQVDYYEVLVDPYLSQNAGRADHLCLVTRRQRVTDPKLQQVEGGRPIAMKLAQTEIGRLAAGIELASTLRRPDVRAPGIVHTSLRTTQVESYTDEWYKILLLRLNINADSAELGVPLTSSEKGVVDPTNAITAVERILALALKNQAEMQKRLAGHSRPFESAFSELCLAWEQAPLHTSPISLRFVRSESAFLSMQYGAPTCMIEMPMPGNDSYEERLRNHPADLHEAGHRPLRLYESYVKGRNSLFETVETALADLNVRPHWGQVNFMTWQKALGVYPRAESWLSIYDKANSTGVFDNPLTDQLGISHSERVSGTRVSGERPDSSPDVAGVSGGAR